MFPRWASLATGMLVAAGTLVPAAVRDVSAATRYLDPTFEVDVQRNVVYSVLPATAGSGAATLTLDLYSPRGDTETNRPVFIYAHGGSFLFGDKADGDPVGWANRMAQRGYVAASINYRLGPALVTPPLDAAERAQIDRARFDMQSAVIWFKANSLELGVDPNRIAVAGTSAGAITALGVALGSNSPDPDPALLAPTPELAAVCGAVSIAGANDPVVADPGDAFAIFHHGTEDGIVPFELAVATRNAMTAAGLAVEWHEYAGEGHSNTFSPTTVSTIRSTTIRWLYDRVATAASPCSPAVANVPRVAASGRTVLRGTASRSAVVSVVAVETRGAGYVQVLPCDSSPGATANVNSDAPGQIRSNLAIVQFGSDGKSCLYNQVTTHLVADLQGWFSNGALDDVPDRRLVDTRSRPQPAVVGSTSFLVGRPSSTAVVSLVATETRAPGYIQVLPCGEQPGRYATLNVDGVGQTRNKLAFVRLDASGRACIYTQTTTHLVVDLQAYMQPGAFDDVDDVRLLDTREGTKPAGGTQTPIEGRPGATAVVSVVATETAGPGYLQVLPCGAAPGATANVNADARDQTVSGLAFVRFGPDGRACVFNQTATHVVVDLQGYLAPGAFEDVDDVRLVDTRVR
jgi:acetyl esterase/lipase